MIGNYVIPYEENTIILSPGERRPMAHVGNVFTLFKSASPVQIAFGAEGEFFSMTPGRSIPGPRDGFSIVRFYNPGASDLTVEYATSIREVRSFDALISATTALPVRGGGGSFSDQEVVVSNVAVQLLLADTGRSAAIIRAGTADLWLGPSAAVVAGAVPTVPAGASLAIGHTGAVFGIRAAAGLVQVGIYEEKV